MSRRKTGIIGEKKAALFLAKDGFVILKRNFRKRSGEIDIIAKQDNTLVFIEVKTSRVYSEDSLEYSINDRKRRKIINTSRYFLKENPEYQEYNIQYDIIFISQKDGKIIHIKNAFYEV